MNIVVCVKQVPSSNEVRLDPITNTIIRDAKQAVINPFDLFAVEQALQLKERYGGQVHVISMGIPAVQGMLRDLLARGADGAYLLTDRAFAGSDTLATSYVLSRGIHKLPQFDLIICGKMATDGDTAQIGPELSAQMQIPCICNVCEILQVTNTNIICKKKTDSGYLVVRGTFPILITVERGINLPRLPSIGGIEFSMKENVICMDAQAIQAERSQCGLAGSPTQVVKTFTPLRTHQAQWLDADISAAANQILEMCKEAR